MLTRRLSSLLTVLLSVPLLALCGCGGSPGATLESYDPPTAAAKAIEIYDSNSDGKLGPEELKKSPALLASFRRLDTNRDGALIADEIQARLEEQNRWAKFLALDLAITTRGRPLVGAKLTLTPEPFMGVGYPTLTGTTVEDGGCPLDAGGRDIPGVPTGFYTVQVVHPGQSIDAVRGVEIAEDTTGSRLQIAL